MKPSVDVLRATVWDCDLIDVSTTQNVLQYRHFQESSDARLGRIYVLPGSASKTLTKFNVTHKHFSDHCMVIVSVGPDQK